MNELNKIDVLASTALTLIDDLADAKAYATAEKSQNTRVAYASDFSIFRAWCLGRGVSALPASPETVAAWLSSAAKAGLKASTIGRRVSAIRYAHKLAGLPTPTDAETLRAVVRGIRRSIGTSPDRKQAATAEIVREMLKCCDDSLRGARNSALISLGFASAMRRSELVALRVEDIEQAPDGLRITIRRSKTDQDAGGQTIAIPHGARIRPVERLRAWLDAAGITEGPVFRRVLKGGQKIGPNALSPLAASDVVKELAEAVGLDPNQFAGHSLRSGFITSAAEAGASVFKLMEVSRHKSIDVLSGYVRSANLFHEHAGSKIL